MHPPQTAPLADDSPALAGTPVSWRGDTRDSGQGPPLGTHCRSPPGQREGSKIPPRHRNRTVCQGHHTSQGRWDPRQLHQGCHCRAPQQKHGGEVSEDHSFQQNLQLYLQMSLESCREAHPEPSAPTSKQHFETAAAQLSTVAADVHGRRDRVKMAPGQQAASHPGANGRSTLGHAHPSCTSHLRKPRKMVAKTQSTSNHTCPGTGPTHVRPSGAALWALRPQNHSRSDSGQEAPGGQADRQATDTEDATPCSRTSHESSAPSPAEQTSQGKGSLWATSTRWAGSYLGLLASSPC